MTNETIPVVYEDGRVDYLSETALVTQVCDGATLTLGGVHRTFRTDRAYYLTTEDGYACHIEGYEDEIERLRAMAVNQTIQTSTMMAEIDNLNRQIREWQQACTGYVAEPTDMNPVHLVGLLRRLDREACEGHHDNR